MKDGGNIINVSSTSARTGDPNTLIYSSTKAAVESITRVLGVELRDRNIKVNAISPGPVVTDVSLIDCTERVLIRCVQMFTAFPEEVQTSIKNSRPVAQPSDIADIVVFLASPASRWITGSTLAASNGFLLI